MITIAVCGYIMIVVCSLKTYEDCELLDMRKGKNYAHMKDSLDDCARL